MWEVYKKNFNNYLQLERSLSDHSVEAYLHDIQKLTDYLQAVDDLKTPQQLTLKDLQAFVKWIAELGMTPGSQARIISGIRAFYKYCLIENIVTADPSVLLEAPKLKRALPDILSYEEIVSIIDAIDLSVSEGTRNKAILETMYSCGLRVTEVINLKISCLYLNEGFIRVTGKGDKERLVPIGDDAVKYIRIYKDTTRKIIAIAKGFDDFLFLNNRGKGLSRVMIFYIIKSLAKKSGHQQDHFATYFSSFFCNPFGGRRRRLTERATNAWPRKHYHH